MMKIFKRCLSLTLALILLCLCLIPVFAFSSSAVTQKQVANIDYTNYENIPIYLYGTPLTKDARLINSTTYVPIRMFFDAFNQDTAIAYHTSTRTANVKTDALDLTITDGGHVLHVNNRCLWTDMPAKILSDGRMYLPIRLLSRTLGLTVDWDNNTRSVYLSGTPVVLENGEDYYNQDDLYWLSRIISAESRGEPLLGQIAVGNVVCNRKASNAYPNTIYGVIFDNQYSVQFSPTADESIYATPTISAITAAKLCLEGVSISSEAMYFFAPAIATSTWIAETRNYLFQIGNHIFYA